MSLDWQKHNVISVLWLAHLGFYVIKDTGQFIGQLFYWLGGAS